MMRLGSNIYLLKVHLTTLLTSRIIQRHIAGRLGNNEVESVRKEAIVAYFEYYLKNCV
jgi:hypothetical protein